MCGRYELNATAKELVRYSPLLHVRPGDIPRADHLSPTDPVLIFTGGSDGYRSSNARWGLVGSFLDREPHSPIINLRGEGLESQPFYGKILKRNRCLIAATAFFEWQTRADGGKQKMRIRDTKAEPLLFAGVFDHHRSAGTTCAILTTAANADVAPVHHRMPLILKREEVDFWLGNHADFPSAEFADIVAAASRGSLSVEAVEEEEPSPQLSFAFA